MSTYRVSEPRTDRAASARVVALLVVTCAVFAPMSAPGQGATTVFTYQGKLDVAGSPPAVAYDFEFTLLDAALGGSVVAAPVTVEDVMLDDGVFSVELDFGAVFGSDSRWLEIGVRDGDDTGPFTLLTPRQRVSAVPQAGFAQVAAVADTLDGLDSSQFLTAAGGTVGDLTLTGQLCLGGECRTSWQHDHFGENWTGDADSRACDSSTAVPPVFSPRARSGVSWPPPPTELGSVSRVMVFAASTAARASSGASESVVKTYRPRARPLVSTEPPRARWVVASSALAAAIHLGQLTAATS